jgi:CreA protein
MTDTVSDLGFDEGLTLAFSSKDRKAAAAWYQAHLGFELMYDEPDMGWCEITSHMTNVTLGFGENIESKPGNCVPVFAVKDIAAFRARLEASNVKFDGPTEDTGYVKLATFYDGDGNALMLSQMMVDESRGA